MTRVAAPAAIGKIIAERAVKSARQDIKGRGWRSSGALQPTYADGQVGIRSTMKHLLYQNKGINSFLMYWVEGRSIPLACKQGDGPHIRKGREVGKPGWVDIPHKGRVFRQQKWRHPGLKPKRFLERALSQAIRDSRNDIRATVMASLKGEQ